MDVRVGLPLNCGHSSTSYHLQRLMKDTSVKQLSVHRRFNRALHEDRNYRLFTLELQGSRSKGCTAKADYMRYNGEVPSFGSYAGERR